MTVNKLYELLHKLVIQGHGRKSVCIDKPSFAHNLENDGCVILEVESAQVRTYNRIGDDGGHALKADGSERLITSLVLDGGGESSFSASAEQT